MWRNINIRHRSRERPAPRTSAQTYVCIGRRASRLRAEERKVGVSQPCQAGAGSRRAGARELPRRGGDRHGVCHGAYSSTAAAVRIVHTGTTYLRSATRYIAVALVAGTTNGTALQLAAVRIDTSLGVGAVDGSVVTQIPLSIIVITEDSCSW